MKIWHCAVLAILLPICCRFAAGQGPTHPEIVDVYPDKARYAPHEEAVLLVSLRNSGDAAADATPAQATLNVSFWHLGKRAGDISKAVTISGSSPTQVRVPWTPPAEDYSGYFADVRLSGPEGQLLDRSQTAIDVSSQWNRFPRYGYLAHYSKAEGADAEAWVEELNKFHIDGLEYYDFQYRHEQPLAGTAEHPDAHWPDIAGREIDRSVIEEFLVAARRHNMMSMAYNSSYSAYAEAFTDGSGVKLQWATWNTPDGPRTLPAANSLVLPVGTGWSTPRLVYMNQNSPEWQNYLFGRMADLFRAYPFDGWHIDTFGSRGAYAYDGSYVDFIAGFRPFVDHAHDVLEKRVVLNTVSTWGQDQMARSAADFVYSELWDDHETYASILEAAAQVHTANPRIGLVFAAYLQRSEKEADRPKTRYFNIPGVLLADAVIFASGASHIELGDGLRMLSGEYFPADARFAVSPDLYKSLRNYYDFLTAYENVLRYEVTSAPATATVADHPSSPYGVPNTIWTVARQKDERTMVHLINLLGSDDPHWRDIQANRPEAPLLTGVKVHIAIDRDIASATWASPDSDGGRLHPLALTRGSKDGERYVDVTLPSLKYWDMIVLEAKAAH